MIYISLVFNRFKTTAACVHSLLNFRIDGEGFCYLLGRRCLIRLGSESWYLFALVMGCRLALVVFGEAILSLVVCFLNIYLRFALGILSSLESTFNVFIFVC